MNQPGNTKLHFSKKAEARGGAEESSGAVGGSRGGRRGHREGKDQEGWFWRKSQPRLTSQELSNFSAAPVSGFRRSGPTRLLSLPPLLFLRLELTIPAFAAGAERKERRKGGRRD